MVLTTDGLGIVRRPDGLREGTRKRQKESNQKLKPRLSKGEKRNRKRLAQVASIYFIDRFVRRPEDIIPEFLRKIASSSTSIRKKSLGECRKGLFARDFRIV